MNNNLFAQFTKDAQAPQTSHLRGAWRWVVDPPLAWRDITEKRQTQLLAFLTFGFALVNTIDVMSNVSRVGWNPQSLFLLLLSLITLAAFGLSRTAYYYTGALIFIWSWAIGAYLNVLLGTSDSAATLNSLLAFVFILAGSLLTVRDLATLTVVNLVALFFINRLLPILSPVESASIAGTSAVIAVLVLILSWYRDTVERQRLQVIRGVNANLQLANEELEAGRNTLSLKVDQRTQELEVANKQNERKAAQFRAITEVTRVINTRQNLQQLLPQITKVISEQFGFYHIGIFMNDSTNQFAILGASNSPGGRKMMERGHRLKIGEQGIIGYVTGTGKPRIALDVGTDAVFFNNPDLPETHSEIGLPLKSGDKVIGALDVQSTQANAFTGEDIDVLSTLADQVSLAIENTRLFEQTQKALQESEAISRQYLQETWGTLLREKPALGFRYASGGVSPLQSNGTAQDESEDTVQRSFMNVPIRLRGNTIGYLKVAMPQNMQMQQNQMDLVNAVADRVALAVENARLFEDTNQRAEQERIISDIASKIGASFRTENVLSTTAKELSKYLEGAEILIQLQPNENGA